MPRKAHPAPLVAKWRKPPLVLRFCFDLLGYTEPALPVLYAELIMSILLLIIHNATTGSLDEFNRDSDSPSRMTFVIGCQ
jgi:hypothetical protein